MVERAPDIPILAAPLPPREPVSQVIYRHLRQHLADARIPPGTRLHEVELAAAWRLSRTPVREALRRLELEGFLRPAGRRGFEVPVRTRSDLEDLFDLQEVLEGLAARRAAERAAAPAVARLNDLIRAHGAALQRRDLDGVLAAHEELHRAITAAAGNACLAAVVDLVRAHLQPARMRVLRTRERATRSFREMAKVTAAIRARDPARAEAAMREHLASVRADVLAQWDQA
ncbi:MAG: GntR family transcriptional regulator [Armatimonadota bacterium]|nr:GntR family transcriptional regulator [Armatimonadota bacterium]MDR7560482.1 GntR family transcriptional regulator [Armatimonadota bacterium]MDR7588537.1 GntR family transcriptional regulator [Armatimonadota bacterium]MDR7612632.1 GntR family transcriptional regulator [Armatimonadota bacterium]